MTNAVNIAQGGSNNVTFRNRIINGNMGIWQRGTSGFTTNNNYSADRWFLTSGGSLSTGAQSTDVPANFKYSLSIAANAYPQVNQRIESLNCIDLSGQTITISYWAKSVSGSTTISTQLAYPTVADNYTSVTYSATNNNTISTAWAQYTTTFTSLSSAVLNGLQVQIFCNTGSSASYLITGVQLEAGTTASPFEYRQYGTELLLCQRYYQTFCGDQNNQNITMFQAYSTTAVNGGVVPFFTKMRVVPTFTYSSLGDFYIQNATGSGYAPSVLQIGGSENSTTVGSLRANVATAGLIAGNASQFFAANTSARLNFSAEL
jgi:hypothetical protein